MRVKYAIEKEPKFSIGLLINNSDLSSKQISSVLKQFTSVQGKVF